MYKSHRKLLCQESRSFLDWANKICDTSYYVFLGTSLVFSVALYFLWYFPKWILQNSYLHHQTYIFFKFFNSKAGFKSKPNPKKSNFLSYLNWCNHAKENKTKKIQFRVQPAVYTKCAHCVTRDAGSSLADSLMRLSAMLCTVGHYN